MAMAMAIAMARYDNDYDYAMTTLLNILLHPAYKCLLSRPKTDRL